MMTVQEFLKSKRRHVPYEGKDLSGLHGSTVGTMLALVPSYCMDLRRPGIVANKSGGPVCYKTDTVKATVHFLGERNYEEENCALNDNCEE